MPLALVSLFALTGQTSCSDEGVHIIARSDSSVEESLLVRQDGVATSSLPSSVAGDFGTVAYNTEEDKHIFLFPGDISQGITPGFQVRLSAGDGVEGSGSAFSMSSLDPSSELESVRVYDSGVCSSASGEVHPLFLALGFPQIFIDALNERPQITNATMKAHSIVPVFQSDLPTFLSTPEDHFEFRLAWDADKFEDGAIGDVFECNGPRVRMNFDVFFDVVGGRAAARIENFYVHVSQQPNWSAPIGSRRCRDGIISRVEDSLQGIVPSEVESELTKMLRNVTRFPVSAFANIDSKACSSSDDCTWTFESHSFKGMCNTTSNTCTHVYADADPTRSHVSSAVRQQNLYGSLPHKDGDLSLLH